MMTFEVEVRQTVKVTLDETKFTPEFMQEFRDSFYQFDDLEEHAAHIGQLAARRIINGEVYEFIEGYGPAEDMGISVSVEGFDTEVIRSQS